MKEATDETDLALDIWGRWARESLGILGWAPISLIAKVVEFGVLGAAQNVGVKLVDVSSLCETVDRAVTRLPALEREVITVYYTKWQPREISALYCGVSPVYFRQILHRGRRSVADYLEGARLRYNKTYANL